MPASPRSRLRRSLLQVEGLEDRTLSAADVAHGTRAPGRVAEVSRQPRTQFRAPQPRALMNVVYSNQGGQAEHLDLYLPRGTAPATGWPVILALPGGGWRWVRRSDLGVAVSKFTEHGYAVAVADYAFATSTPGSRVWPRNFDDVQRAVQWLRRQSGRFHLDPTRIAAWGESAGGHLAALLGTAARPSARVQAVIDFYGPSDLTALYDDSSRSRPYVQTFLGGRPDQVPDRYRDASPVSWVSPDDPPFLIYQGKADPVVPYTQSESLAAALTEAGVPNHVAIFPGAKHGFRLEVGPTLNLTSQVLAFLDDALNHGGEGIDDLAT